jgi:hypothetical protein
MYCLSKQLDFGDTSKTAQFFSELPELGSGTGNANVVFVIGRALKGHINNEQRAIFGNPNSFDAYFGPASQALNFYERGDPRARSNGSVQ